MVHFALGNDGRFISEEYRQVRKDSQEETMNLSEWGDIDIQKYDLDNLNFSGKENAQTYKFRHPIQDDEINITGFDLRKLKDR